MREKWEELGVQSYGLTSDLIVPIAAADLAAIETYVGTIHKQIPGRIRPTNAVVVEAKRPDRNPLVPRLHRIQESVEKARLWRTH